MKTKPTKDNVLIFTKTNAKSLKAIKEILGIFFKFSGLDVNECKRSVFYSKSAMDVHQFHEISGFPVKNLPLTYLGIPISGKRKSTANVTNLSSLWKIPYLRGRASASLMVVESSRSTGFFLARFSTGLMDLYSLLA